MGLELQQRTTLKQKQTMTPLMLQSINYLQYSMVQLKDELRKEINKNPLLDDDDVNVNFEKNNLKDDTTEKQDDKMINNSDFDWESYLDIKGISFNKGFKTRNPDYDELYDLDRKSNTHTTLKEHLKEQVNIHIKSDIDKFIAYLIIENINSRGMLDKFIDEDTKKETVIDYIVDEINAYYGNETITQEDVFEVLRKIHRLDPIGCGAFSELESLYIQAEIKGYPDYVKRILKEGGEFLKNNKIKELKEKLSVSEKQIKKALEMLNNLDPIPGRNFWNGDPEYIIPEIRVVKYGDEYMVEPIKEVYPRVRMSYYYNQYKLLLKENKLTQEEKKFYEENIKKAKEILNSVVQRERTIVRVMKTIVRAQKEYFDSGGNDEFLKPLIRKDIAIELGLNESSISRAIKDKYVETPFGIYELSKFFSTSVKGSNGPESMVKVKKLIKNIIDKEDKKKPLSDTKISKLLKDEYNLKIERKTICNYRKDLNIPKASERKQKI